MINNRVRMDVHRIISRGSRHPALSRRSVVLAAPAAAPTSLASGSQRMPNVGAIGFALTVAAYLYYSLWVLLTPFVEKDVVWFHNLFPDTWWALAVPTALLVLGVTCVITFVGILGR